VSDEKRIRELEAEVARLTATKMTRGQFNRMRKARTAGLVLKDGKVSYELQPEEKEAKERCGWDHPDNDLAWDPGPKQRIPKDGAWVMITRTLPPIERGLNRNLMVGRIFWCDHQSGADEAGFTRDGLYKVICRSPWGDVWLWPYEYSRMEIPEILSLWQTNDVVFVPTNVQLARFNDIVFYARSRGIALADAMVMALGTLSGPVGWFRPASFEVQREAIRMEKRVHEPLALRRSRRTSHEPMEVKIEVKS